MAAAAIHPGEHLGEELKTLDMSAAELARKISVPTNWVTQILNGRRGVTGDTALRLGQWFGSSARFWLNLQAAYDIRTAEGYASNQYSQVEVTSTQLTGGQWVGPAVRT